MSGDDESSLHDDKRCRDTSENGAAQNDEAVLR